MAARLKMGSWFRHGEFSQIREDYVFFQWSRFQILVKTIQGDSHIVLEALGDVK